jgi:hypothetical protein
LLTRIISRKSCRKEKAHAGNAGSVAKAANIWARIISAKSTTLAPGLVTRIFL